MRDHGPLGAVVPVESPLAQRRPAPLSSALARLLGSRHGTEFLGDSHTVPTARREVFSGGDTVGQLPRARSRAAVAAALVCGGGDPAVAACSDSFWAVPRWRASARRGLPRREPASSMASAFCCMDR